jgi:hypothetical protein
VQTTTEMRISTRNRDTSLRVEIPLSIPKDNRMTFQIHDVSDTGFLFLSPETKDFFTKKQCWKT